MADDTNWEIGNAAERDDLDGECSFCRSMPTGSNPTFEHYLVTINGQRSVHELCTACAKRLDRMGAGLVALGPDGIDGVETAADVDVGGQA